MACNLSPKLAVQSKIQNPRSKIDVSLLTGGGDRPYVFGLATALMAKGIALDLIGSDEVDFPEFHAPVAPASGRQHLSGVGQVNFLNLRGDQRPDARMPRKILRVLIYYARLLRYACTAKPKVFHILFNNKFEIFDRTLLMLYYRLLGKRTVMTLHNVNAARRDGKDTLVNRLTLSAQYRLADHLFVHTEKMKQEVVEEFGIEGARVTVIPFGINNAVPHTNLTPHQAKQRLGIRDDEKTILFFGLITPYKGLEYLAPAFHDVLTRRQDYRLIIAGSVKNCNGYWEGIREGIHEDVLRGRVLVRDDFIPDDETEIYFKSADVVVLPYTHVYQSGVLFLAHSFGLPVLAADVGSLKDDIVEGKTGFVFRPADAAELAKSIERYFASDLYRELNNRRPEIQQYARERHSWGVVSDITVAAYERLLEQGLLPRSAQRTQRPAATDH